MTCYVRLAWERGEYPVLHKDRLIRALTGYGALWSAARSNRVHEIIASRVMMVVQKSEGQKNLVLSVSMTPFSFLMLPPYYVV